jgi:hypothetical protein
MNEEPLRPTLPSMPPRMTHFDTISDDAKKSVSLRGLRRATAINAVAMAREHAQRGSEPYNQNEADVIMAIMELLDKVAGAT